MKLALRKEVKQKQQRAGRKEQLVSVQQEATKINGIHSWGWFLPQSEHHPQLTSNWSAERQFTGRDIKLIDIGSSANFNEEKVTRVQETVGWEKKEAYKY